MRKRLSAAQTQFEVMNGTKAMSCTAIDIAPLLSSIPLGGISPVFLAFIWLISFENFTITFFYIIRSHRSPSRFLLRCLRSSLAYCSNFSPFHASKWNNFVYIPISVGKHFPNAMLRIHSNVRSVLAGSGRNRSNVKHTIVRSRIERANRMSVRLLWLCDARCVRVSASRKMQMQMLHEESDNKMSKNK